MSVFTMNLILLVAAPFRYMRRLFTRKCCEASASSDVRCRKLVWRPPPIETGGGGAGSSSSVSWAWSGPARPIQPANATTSAAAGWPCRPRRTRLLRCLCL